MIQYALDADIGGTNARIALCDKQNGAISHIDVLAGADFASFADATRHYLGSVSCEIKQACIAIAAPIKDGYINMPNTPWQFHVDELKQELALDALFVINDFEAISYALPMLEPSDLVKLGGDKPLKGSPNVIYGPGTGLGVAYTTTVNDQYIVLPSETGHAKTGPLHKDELPVFTQLFKMIEDVEGQTLISGQGIVNIYRALMLSRNRTPVYDNPAKITELALAGSCQDCIDTLDFFCCYLGRCGGDLALSLNTWGGVYIAGGIAPKIIEFLKQSRFRQGFEDKGKQSDLLRPVPVYVIMHHNPGLLGAGFYLREIAVQ